MLKSSVRKHDVVGRWGGEEFILLLPEAPLAGGEKAAEGIRKKIEAETFFFKNREISLSITFGVSEFNGTTDIDGCIKKADEALYSGKRKGKNRVVASP
jgi:diguanylate cyclase (GGDEF)-like protein